MMSTHQQDEAIAEELKAHHRVMIEDLRRLSNALEDEARRESDGAAVKRELEDWIANVLIPHAEEEETTTYRAAAKISEGTLLIKSMLAEHQLIRHAAANLSASTSAIEAAAHGRALFQVFDSHQHKENDLILPLLVASKDVSLAEVMASAHAHGDVHDHGRGHAH